MCLLVLFCFDLSCVLCVLVFYSEFFYFLCFGLVSLFLFFFFSSRRRHTRCLSDWSSDVCSSDLTLSRDGAASLRCEPTIAPDDNFKLVSVTVPAPTSSLSSLANSSVVSGNRRNKIGRASCRERV